VTSAACLASSGRQAYLENLNGFPEQFQKAARAAFFNSTIATSHYKTKFSGFKE
jgi:hypothetical protein